MVLAANTELAAMVLPEARTVEPVTTVAALRVVAEATLAPFTTLPAATTVPAASVLPPATTAVLATATEPPANVVPAINGFIHPIDGACYPKETKMDVTFQLRI
jgi:hypothetical protein